MAKVSVCIPSFQYPRVVETIRGVVAQTFQDWELLIEDDGSKDETPAILKAFIEALNDPRIKLTLKEQNEGQNKTTNNMAQRATGEYLYLLPCDDLPMPEKLAKQVAHLDAHPECGIVFGQPRFITHDGKPYKYPHDGIENITNKPRSTWRNIFQNGNVLFIPTSLYRRSLHDALGYFDESLAILADLEWYIRVTKDHELHVIEEPLATITLRKDNANLSSMTTATMEKISEEQEIIRERHWPIDREKKKYFFATPFYELKGYSPYIRSMFQTVYALARHTKVEFEYMERSGDSYVWRARNMLADAFMRSDCSHLFFIDSDHGWSLEAIMRVLKADVEIVGATYPMKNGWDQYAGTVYTDQYGNPEVDKETGLIRAHSVPTGFMKISRSVFEKMKKEMPGNWYFDTDENGITRKFWDYFGHVTNHHVKLGEDISFCRRWEMIGGELWIEPRCDIQHCGQKIWEGNFHEYLLRRPGGSKSTEPHPNPAPAVNDSTSTEAA